MRKILIVALILIATACAGCFESKFALTITDSGEVIQQCKFIGTAALSKQIEDWKNQAEANNPNLKAKAVEQGDMRGYIFDLTYPDIETFTRYGGELYAAHVGKNEGITQKKTWFFDEYDFDLYWISSPAKSAFDSTVNQALMSQAVFDVELNLPYAAESTNADEVSADGKYLKWHLAHITINGGEKFMKAHFKIWHRDKIVLTTIMEVSLLIATIFFFIKARAEDLEPEQVRNLRSQQNLFVGLFVALTLISACMILTAIP